MYSGNGAPNFFGIAGVVYEILHKENFGLFLFGTQCTEWPKLSEDTAPDHCMTVDLMLLNFTYLYR